jgi:HD superfamily phosphodiesterase
MNINKKSILIEEAKKILEQNPQDSAHDLEHAIRVWENAKTIVEKEDLQDVNMDILEIICYWHDVHNPDLDDKDDNRRIAEITAEYISEKFSEPEKPIIFNSIRNHEFGSKPRFLEGKILQDADKLEVLSRERGNKILESINGDKKEEERILKFLKSFRDDWIPKLYERFHFQYSKDFYTENIDEFKEYIDEKIYDLENK